MQRPRDHPSSPILVVFAVCGKVRAHLPLSKDLTFAATKRFGTELGSASFDEREPARLPCIRRRGAINEWCGYVVE